MKITWLGQAGLLLRANDAVIMIDPYLSNSVEKVNAANYRRTPIKQSVFDITPDVMIFTHDHLDHYDPETAPRFLKKTDKCMTVLSPTSVWQKARTNGGGHNYVQFDRHTEWSEYGLRFTAVKAVHSDAHAIGVIIEDMISGKQVYITGDTLYNTDIFGDIKGDIDALFLPINGVGNNMNMTDAARFAQRIGAKVTVPYHFGMFDELDVWDFVCENRYIPKAYEEFEI